MSDAWWELELSFFYPGAPYRDMAWWYLRHRFDDATLSAHGLNMPPWPDDNPAPPATWPVVLDMMERPPWLEGKALWWTRYISARGTAPSDQLRSALLALLQCAPAPHSIAALCAQLNRAEVTLVPLLRALKNAKLLTETPQGWCLA